MHFSLYKIELLYLYELLSSFIATIDDILTALPAIFESFKNIYFIFRISEMYSSGNILNRDKKYFSF